MHRLYNKGSKIAYTALAIATLGLSTNAFAADAITGTGTTYAEPGIDQQANADLWNGVYGGVLGGYQWQSVGVMSGTDIDGVNGKELGGFIGYNQALGNALVGGLELQGAYSGAKESNGGITARQDYETSLRARMGYALEQNMIYGLAGLSAARVELDDGASTDKKWLKGWTVGAGVEREFSNNVFGRVEYDYTKYGEKGFDLSSGNANADLAGHGLKVGVGLQF